MSNNKKVRAKDKLPLVKESVRFLKPTADITPEQQAKSNKGPTCGPSH